MAPSLGIESLSSNSTLRNRAHLFTAELVFLCHRRAMCLECKEENKFQVIIQRACPPSIASQERAEKMGRTHGVGSQELARHRQVFSFLLKLWDWLSAAFQLTLRGYCIVTGQLTAEFILECPSLMKLTIRV